MGESIYPHQIKELRKRLGETQEGLAQLLNVTASTVAKWESGASRPTGDRALAIQRLRGEAPQPPRRAMTVPETVGIYDHAIDTWEGERDSCIRGGESTRLADTILRVLRNTRDKLIKTATGDESDPRNPDPNPHPQKDS